MILIGEKWTYKGGRKRREKIQKAVLMRIYSNFLPSTPIGPLGRVKPKLTYFSICCNTIGIKMNLLLPRIFIKKQNTGSFGKVLICYDSGKKPEAIANMVETIIMEYSQKTGPEPDIHQDASVNKELPAGLSIGMGGLLDAALIMGVVGLNATTKNPYIAGRPLDSLRAFWQKKCH
jgi:hypothetical protein